MVFVMSVRSLPFRPPAAAAVVTAALAVAATTTTGAEAQAPCPGAQPACVYGAQSEIGSRSGGALRFPQALAVSGDTLYVGDQGSNVVHAFRTTDGAFLREVGRPGTRAGEVTAVGALATAGDGSLIVADGSNRILRFGADGSFLNQWGRPGTEPGQFRFGGGRGNDAGAGGGVAVSGDVVYVADSGNNRLQRFTLSGESRGVIVPPGTLGYPKGVAARGSRLLVADNQNHRVLVLDNGGRLLHEIKTDASAGRGDLSHPYGVAFDPAGRVFVADNMNHRVVRFSTGPAYPYKGRWGAFGTSAGRLAYPRSIATDGAGNVYVANTGNDRVDVYDKGGALLRSIGRSGRATGEFNAPAGVAADAAGFRAVADSINGRIQLIGPDGKVAAVWGSPNPGPTILQRPVAVAFDGAGDAYVLDTRRARIFPFARSKGTPGTPIGAQGRGPGKLMDPSAIASDNAGNLYVADTGNERIAMFTKNGTWLGALDDGVGKVRGVAVTPDGSRIYGVAENRITAYDRHGVSLDEFGGTGSKLGKLNAPSQITLDAAGNVWVADTGNHRVQQFGPEGERLATFGERGTGAGQFTAPTSVAVDCTGRLTVTDRENNRVQQFQLLNPSASPCGALPAPATPPAPKTPTLPDPEGPAVTLKPLRASGVLAARNLPVRVGCDTACTVTGTLKLTPRAAPKKPKGKGKKAPAPTVITLTAPSTAVPAGESKIVRFTLTAAQVKTLRKALGGKTGLYADLSLTASAAAGAPAQLSERLSPTA